MKKAYVGPHQAGEAETLPHAIKPSKDVDSDTNTAEQFLRELAARLQKFGLRLHPDKTRLIEFGRLCPSSKAA